MGLFCGLVVCLAIVSIDGTKSQSTNEEETDIRKLYAYVEKKFAALEHKLTNGEKENDASLLNDTNLEARVQALEFQMENVHEDITAINTEVADLEEDTEAQITIIQADISVLNSEQNLQDAQIVEIENSVETIEIDVARIGELEASLLEVNDSLTSEFDILSETVGELSDDLQKSVTALQNTDTELSEDISNLNNSLAAITDDLEGVTDDIQELTAATDDLLSSVISLQETDAGLTDDLEGVTEDVQELTAATDDLLSSVISLQETDTGLIEDIEQLSEADTSLDSRLSQLEMDGTFAFHAVRGTYTSIPVDSVVVFNNVNVNLGGGYNGATGQFIVPTGGAGLYYFYAHFSLEGGRQAWLNIRKNSVTVAMMNEDATQTGEYPAGSCGAVMQLQDGKVKSLSVIQEHSI